MCSCCAHRALSSAIASSSHATIVFSNFGPGLSFPDSGRILQGPLVGNIADVDQAASFINGPFTTFVTDVKLGIYVDSPANQPVRRPRPARCDYRQRFRRPPRRRHPHHVAESEHVLSANRRRSDWRHRNLGSKHQVLDHRRRQRHIRRRLGIQPHQRFRPRRRPQQQRPLEPAKRQRPTSRLPSRRPHVPEPTILGLLTTAFLVTSCTRSRRKVLA